MFIAGALTALFLFGGGLGLVADEELGTGAGESDQPASPSPEEGRNGAAALLGITAAMAAAIVLRGPGEALGLKPPDDALIVFVPGHGQGHGSSVFAEFMDNAGIEPESARFFDYRWVTGGSDASQAAQLAPITPTARSLNAYLAGLASEGRPMWLVGFSKGGATLAELIAEWDKGAWGPTHRIEGAMLLEPPIARGPLGWLQSAGRHIGWIPDDGGYEPVECAFLKIGCHDTRIGLGSKAGIDVLVVRNPQAAVTTFLDHPLGLRVLDAPDDGPGPWGQLLNNPIGLPGRIAAAHESVLSDPAVARCLVKEMWSPGSCSLPDADAWSSLPLWKARKLM